MLVELAVRLVEVGVGIGLGLSIVVLDRQKYLWTFHLKQLAELFVFLVGFLYIRLSQVVFWASLYRVKTLDHKSIYSHPIFFVIIFNELFNPNKHY